MNRDLVTARRKIPAAFYANMPLAGAVMIALGPLLDPILADTGIPRAQGGTLAIAFFLGMNGAIYALNFAIAGLSPRHTLLLGVAVQAAGLVGLAWWGTSLATLCLPLALVGFGYGILNAFPGIYVSCAVKEGCERAMNLVHGLFGLGVTATPVLIGRLLAAGASWRAVVLGGAALTSLVGALVLVLPPEEIPGRRNLDRRLLLKTWRHNPRLWVLVFLACALYVGAESIYNVWLAKFQIDALGAGPVRAGLTVTLCWAGMSLGRLAYTAAAPRVPVHMAILAACAATGALMIAVALSPSQGWSEVLTFPLGMAMGVVFPLLVSYAGGFPTWLAGAVYSSLHFAAGLGGLSIPYLVGPAADALGFRAAMGLAVLPLVLVGLLVLWARRHAARVP